MEVHLKIFVLAGLITLTFGCSKIFYHTSGFDDKARAVYLDQPFKGTCSSKPYVPGGGKVIIESFDAPQAEIQHNGIANMAKWVGLSADVSSDLSAIAEASGKAFKSCAMLGANLGIWGTVFGFISSQGTPTPDDIIDATNKALTELTKNVNDQFSNMVDYVNQQVMDESKDRWEDKYSGWYNKFRKCAQYDPEGETKVLACLESVELDSGSEGQSVFMDYVGYLDDSNWKPSREDVRHMEVQFNIYFNFVHLRMMILLTMYGEYKDKTNDADKTMAKTYLQYLKEESLLYKRYTQFVYDKIVAAYEAWNWQKWGGSCSCGNVHNICEGAFGGVNTAATIDCQSLFDEVSLSPADTCNYQVKVRCDGKAPSSTAVMIFDIDPLTKVTFADHIYDWQVKPKYLDFHAKLLSQVKTFWKPSVLKSQETLQQIHDGADQILKTKYDGVTAYHRGEYKSQAAHKFGSEYRKMIEKERDEEFKRVQMAIAKQKENERVDL